MPTYGQRYHKHNGIQFPVDALVEACLKRQNRGYSIISPAEKSIGDELAAAEF
jgi:hypothetical protein